MKINEINSLKKKDYIVLLPKCDYDIYDSVTYSFHNVFYLDYSLEKNDAQILIDYVNQTENMQLILFDYDDFYRLILPYIKKEKKIKWIYKSNCASLTEGAIRTIFSSIMEFYDRNIINEIGCIDYATYEVLKNSGYKVKYIKMDVEKKKKINAKSESIGIIGNDYNPNHNIYNELSALKLIDYESVKLIHTMPVTEHFIKFFNIKENKVDTMDAVISNNFVNLYCNFTDTNNELVLKSMDLGIPCILGNTDIFDSNEILKNNLVLKSDDDINEIADKIDNVRKNKKIIDQEYSKFREKYSLESSKSISEFLH